MIRNARVDDVCKVLRRGERVWCKIVYLDYNDNEIGLSMKLVDQRNGTDLDPRGVNYHRYEDEMVEMDNITTGFSNFIEDVSKFGNVNNEDFIKMLMLRAAKQRIP
ncbi:hypothetical protein HCN44_010704 [Aphidius gifuensis]|uniref:Uncharacterized protein n=1 Tax=Aphidius gifuensis TaxID=684658 RepID=A0A834XR44_APHGI|nr:hypothetical protein HCN44_010704 [Aphidius gifuensis]